METSFIFTICKCKSIKFGTKRMTMIVDVWNRNDNMMDQDLIIMFVQTLVSKITILRQSKWFGLFVNMLIHNWKKCQNEHLSFIVKQEKYVNIKLLSFPWPRSFFDIRLKWRYYFPVPDYSENIFRRLCQSPMRFSKGHRWLFENTDEIYLAWWCGIEFILGTDRCNVLLFFIVLLSRWI